MLAGHLMGHVPGAVRLLYKMRKLKLLRDALKMKCLEGLENWNLSFFSFLDIILAGSLGQWEGITHGSDGKNIGCRIFGNF